MFKPDDNSNRLMPMNRRSFLVLSGMLGAATAIPSVLVSRAEAVSFDKKRRKVSKTLSKIGTFVTITVIHPSQDQAQEAIGRAFAEIDRLERVFNRFDRATAIGSLNADGYLKDLPPEMSHVLSRALQYHRTSGGRFDITVKPVVDMFQARMRTRKQQLPSQKDLDNVLALVGSDKLRLENNNLRFARPGMGITLDGIAKGYIVDQASALLGRLGVTDHLINAGGDIRVSGTKPGDMPWTVAIEDPAKKQNYPDIIRLKDGAVATSGNYEVYYDNEKMFHHIVNPRSGMSPHLNSSVSVTAATTMDADALSTSVFVMTPKQGIAFIEQVPACECLVVTRNRKQLKSNGWKSAKG